jgi:hypothetical protein
MSSPSAEFVSGQKLYSTLSVQLPSAFKQKLYSTLSVQLRSAFGVNLKTVPALEAPPPVVVPYRFPAASKMRPASLIG